MKVELKPNHVFQWVLFLDGVPIAQGSIETVSKNPLYWEQDKFKEGE